MATGGWGPGPGQAGGNGPGGPGWGAPYGPPQGNPYGPPPPNPGPYPNPYPYGPQPTPSPAARRPRGCLWYLSPFSIALVILRSAHRVATRLFANEGDGRIVDRTVDRVQLARTVLGAAAAIALVLAYSVNPDDLSDAAYGSAANMFIAPFLLMVAGPLVILGFIYYAPPHLRPHLRSRLRAPLKAVGWYVLTLLAIASVLYVLALSPLEKTDDLNWLNCVKAAAAMAVIFWGIPFFALASLYSARTAFNTAHVHPMLPPVVTTVLVWVIGIFNAIDGGLPHGPPVVQFCSLLGGPLSVTAVSLWELHRMKTRYGVTLRT
ncbi:hypothetical protein [Streptomyces sp. SAS_270]|uniref:hypothetical protein n=1 Tax=Streptomyces sp. SAS_270 TaxID=3412748 RepID=UPI00403CDC8B